MENKNLVQAMEKEISMIMKNKTWEMLTKPEGRNVLGLKWVYKTKLNSDSTLKKLNAMLVVKGYA